MQDVVWQRWLEIWRRVGAELEQAPARLSVRRAELGIALVLTFFFLFAGGLAGRAALIGLVAVAAWAALWPIDETARAARAAVATGEPAPGNDGMLRMVIDAVPEPAAVLDHEGYVIHANRLAEDLFGARRRGGHAASHVAAMSRDPELLAAVDQALISGEAASIELHERVPVERRLLATVAPLAQPRPGAGGPSLLVSFRDSERAGPARAHARRLRRQRQPRATGPLSPRCAASSRRCRGQPRTTSRRASASSRS